MFLLGIAGCVVVRAETPAALTCTAGVDGPATVRAEGMAELVGDVVLHCTGGTPTATVQLTLNTAIAGEARLIVEGTVPVVYKARPGAAANTVTWIDVPFDAPATTERVIRLSHVHADASVIPNDIVAFVLITGAPSIAVVNPQQTVAHVKQGLLVGAERGVLRQCGSRDSPDKAAGSIVLKEGFAQSFAGARIRIRFSNAGGGVPIVVPRVVLLTAEKTLNWAGGYLQLLGDPGAAEAVYEVMNSNPSVVEIADIPIRAGPVSNATFGTVTAQVSFDPASEFRAGEKPLEVFRIEACACRLLFPAVTQTAGTDTTIVILNTTPDPFGAAAQTGEVKLWFYGTNAPASRQAANTLSAGQVMTWHAPAGFDGFVIAQASFQNCAGFAYIWDRETHKRLDRYEAIWLPSLH